jgi:hypothetical protein
LLKINEKPRSMVVKRVIAARLCWTRSAQHLLVLEMQCYFCDLLSGPTCDEVLTHGWPVAVHKVLRQLRHRRRWWLAPAGNLITQMREYSALHRLVEVQARRTAHRQTD